MSDLGRKLKVPQNWLINGGELMEQVGLITSKPLSDGDIALYPALPVDQLTLREIKERIRGPVNSVFVSWAAEAEPSVATACKLIWENRSNRCDEQNWGKIANAST